MGWVVTVVVVVSTGAVVVAVGAVVLLVVVLVATGFEAGDTESVPSLPSPHPPARTAAEMMMAPRPTRMFIRNSSVYWLTHRSSGACDARIGEL